MERRRNFNLFLVFFYMVLCRIKWIHDLIRFLKSLHVSILILGAYKNNYLSLTFKVCILSKSMQRRTMIPQKNKINYFHFSEEPKVSVCPWSCLLQYDKCIFFFLTFYLFILRESVCLRVRGSQRGGGAERDRGKERILSRLHA